MSSDQSNNEKTTIVYIPTPEEQQKIDLICQKCIDVISEMPDLEQKAYVLKVLVDGFKDASGIDIAKVDDVVSGEYDEKD